MKKMIKTILSETLKNNGISIDIYTGKIPTSGFMVSEAGSEKQFQLRMFGEEQIKYFIDTYPEPLKTGAYLGTWIEGKVVYMDVSRRWENKKFATDKALKNGQKAIYDVKNQTVIYV